MHRVSSSGNSLYGNQESKTDEKFNDVAFENDGLLLLLLCRKYIALLN